MRSSTFSSDRVEGVLDVSHALLGLLAGLILLGAIELFWLSLGASSGYVDSKPRWSWVRSEATVNPGVVLLGDSRMHFGFSLRAFRDRYRDMPVYQLATPGEQPYATLRNLAFDEDFTGTVLISFTPDVVMEFRRNEQQANVDHYESRWTIDARVNLYLRNYAEQILITRHHNYGVNSVLRSLLTGRGLPIAILYLETEVDREIHADYSLEDVQAHRGRREGEAKDLYHSLHPVSVDMWRSELADFIKLVRRIQDRGGCVIAVRFPTQDGMYDYEKLLFPRDSFWSVFERDTHIRTVHFESLEVMDSIHLPDMQHVEKKDKYRFTEALLEQIAATKPDNDTSCKL